MAFWHCSDVDKAPMVVYCTVRVIEILFTPGQWVALSFQMVLILQQFENTAGKGENPIPVN